MARAARGSAFWKASENRRPVNADHGSHDARGTADEYQRTRRGIELVARYADQNRQENQSAKGLVEIAAGQKLER